VTGRTVRDGLVDGLQKLTEQTELHLEIRTVCTLPADGPRATCAARMVRDTQADGPQTTCNDTQPLRRIEPRTRKNKRGTGQTQGLTDCPCLPGGLSSRCGQSCSSPKMRSQPLLSIHGSPKWLELLRIDLGRCEVSVGDAMPQNFSPQTN
jgi:hypothetical protein